MKKFLSEPYLLTLNPSTEMNILWIQSHPDDSYLEFGMTEELESSAIAECYEIKGLRGPLENGTYGEDPHDHPPIPVWQYIVKLDGLLPGQKVFYRVISGDDTTQVYSFHTAPKKGESFRFGQLSDLQGLPGCNDSVYKIGCMDLDFLLFSGDMTYVSWKLGQWFDTGEPWQTEDDAKRSFFGCMQQQNGAKLMQFMPTFICPGNHELDDLRCRSVIEVSLLDSNWNWSIFMQLFRPLYKTDDTGLRGKRWYSVDYADMHITSLSINRHSFWSPETFPGWKLYDPIYPGSPQIQWLEQDLSHCDQKYKWVIQHFHILNKGFDVQFNLCEPVIDQKNNVTYPHDHGGALMDIYAQYGVNAVSFGHSHVYERYYHKGTHYIEAAYLSICFRREGDKPHPSGILPIAEDYSEPSFITVERNSEGLFATGYYVNDLRVFDRYQIADATGKTVAPPSILSKQA